MGNTSSDIDYILKIRDTCNFLLSSIKSDTVSYYFSATTESTPTMSIENLFEIQQNGTQNPGEADELRSQKQCPSILKDLSS